MNGIVVKPEAAAVRLVWERCDELAPGPGEVLLNVAAAGVNRADLLQAVGKYPPPAGASTILGLEAAGTIAKLGAGVKGWGLGDRVMALLVGGAYAEQVIVPEAQLIPIPDSMSFIEAAAIPEAFITAYLNIVIEGRLRQGESVLIHAGASGVGAAAIQLVKLLGADAICTVGSDRKADFCRQLGSSLVINYKHTPEFVQPILAERNGRGVDIILDCIGGSYLKRNIDLLAVGGRMVSIGLLGGRMGELDMAMLLSKRLELKGSTLRNRPAAEKARLTASFCAELLPRFQAGELRATVDRTFPITEADAAHRYMMENLNIGKIVLTVS